MTVDTFTADWTSGDMTVVASGVTVTDGGIYAANATMSVSVTSGDTIEMWLTVDGTEVSSMQTSYPVTYHATPTLGDVYQLTSGQTVGVSIEATVTAETLYSGTTQSYLTLYQIAGA